ncbi:unnamed protein product [Pedinophyceae sp. YPF-701]|nr:unnamed protein product [Pedinophyceae sp. YPF-701]
MPQERCGRVLVVQVTPDPVFFVVVSRPSAFGGALLLGVHQSSGQAYFRDQPGDGIFEDEGRAMEHLRQLGQTAVVADGEVLLGWTVGTGRTLILLGTKTASSCALPGGHVVRTVVERRWVQLPLVSVPNRGEGWQGEAQAGWAPEAGPGGQLPPPPSRQEQRALSLLTEFPLEGAHYFCDTLDVAVPFGLGGGVRAEPGQPQERAFSEQRASEWVWNEHLTSGLAAVGAARAAPRLLQGVATNKVLPTVSGELHIATLSRRSRWNAGTRYKARGLDENACPGNEVEAEMLVFERRGGGKPERWARWCWRRGTVPINWRVELQNSGLGEAEIIISEDPYRGTGTYLRRLASQHARAGAPPPRLVCLNLLRCSPGRPELTLSEHFQQAVREARAGGLPVDVQVMNFDWHATIKALGETKAVEGFWSVIRPVVEASGVAAGTCAPGGAPEVERHQRGLLRLNCADSLDRTNAASFFIAVLALVMAGGEAGVDVSPAAAASAAGQLSGMHGSRSTPNFRPVDRAASAARMPAPVSVLPDGWEARVDPATGRTFYIDHNNKTTSWSPPVHAAAAPPEAAAGPAAAAAVGGWTVDAARAAVRADALLAMSEMFLINGDLHAMFYTGSRAMHSGVLSLLNGNNNGRFRGVSGAANLSISLQRRYQNVVMDASRQLQMELFLGSQTLTGSPNSALAAAAAADSARKAQWNGSASVHDVRGSPAGGAPATPSDGGDANWSRGGVSSTHAASAVHAPDALAAPAVADISETDGFEGSEPARELHFELGGLGLGGGLEMTSGDADRAGGREEEAVVSAAAPLIDL